jgi:hypothetical protein
MIELGEPGGVSPGVRTGGLTPPRSPIENRGANAAPLAMWKDL